MPLYQFSCDNDGGCMACFDITMSLSDKDKYDRGRYAKSDKFKCPECGKRLRYVIAPARLSSDRCTAGY